MISEGTLRFVLAGTALVAAGLALAVVCAAAVRSARARSVAPREALARRALTRHLAGDGLSPSERSSLHALPPSVRIGLLAALGAALSGSGRDRLTALATDLGVSAWAERCCRSRRWWRRLRGVRVLTSVGGGDDVVPALLRDAHREVRAAAAAWSVDRPRPDSVARLLDLLGDPEPLVRFAAKNALLRIGRESVEGVADRISKANGRQLEELLEVAIGLAEPRLAAPAQRLVADRSPRVRALTARLIAAVGGARAVVAVEALLNDPDSEVRAAAVAGLGQLGHWPSGPAIAAALRDPAWDVRRQAALALRALGAPGLVLLRCALSDDDRYARDIARQVLDLPVAAPVGSHARAAVSA